MLSLIFHHHDNKLVRSWHGGKFQMSDTWIAHKHLFDVSTAAWILNCRLPSKTQQKRNTSPAFEWMELMEFQDFLGSVFCQIQNHFSPFLQFVSIRIIFFTQSRPNLCSQILSCRMYAYIPVNAVWPTWAFIGAYSWHTLV